MRRRSVVRDLGRVAILGCRRRSSLVAGYATYRIWAQGQRRRAAAGRRDRRHGRRPVRRPAVADLRRPARPRGRRSISRASRRRLVVTGGKADGDRTTEAATARAYAIARGVPADGDPGRGPAAGPPSNRSGRSSALLRDHGLADAVFVSDRPHMLRVLRMAHDDGHRRPGARPPRPARSRTTPVGRLDATDPRARCAGGVLPGGDRRVGRSLRRSRRAGTVFPLGDRGLAPYTVPKPALIGPPQGPATPTRTGPDSPCPSTERGSP